MSSLRMLRGDGDIRDMEHLIRTHHNCLLKADRIRFKKAATTSNNNPNWPYKGKASLSKLAAKLLQSKTNLDSVESAERDQPKGAAAESGAGGRLKLAALIGWHRVGGNANEKSPTTQHRPSSLGEWSKNGFYPVRFTLLPVNYQTDRRLTSSLLDSEESKDQD